jgi:hypothetical protein
LHQNLTANVQVLNGDMKLNWEKEEKFTIGADRYQELFRLTSLENLTPTYFVKLVLKDSEGKILSDNFYWFSSKKDKVDLTDIAKLPKVNLDIKHELSYDEYDEGYMKVVVTNPTDKLAFFNRLLITKGEGGDEVWPTFWSDNFFSLMPGEEKVITARFAKQDLDGEKPVLVLDKDI